MAKRKRRSSLDAAIGRAAEEFSEKVHKLVSKELASREDDLKRKLSQALSVLTGATAKTTSKKPKRAGAARRRKKVSAETVRDAALKALKASKKPTGMSKLSTESGYSAQQLRTALLAPIDSGEVIRKGEKRATTYELRGGAAKPSKKKAAKKKPAKMKPAAKKKVAKKKVAAKKATGK